VVSAPVVDHLRRLCPQHSFGRSRKSSPSIASVKGAELHLFIVLAGMQRIEIGIAIDAQDDRLAINDEMLLAILQGGFNDPRKALCPIVPAASNQPYPIAVALNAQAVTIVLDLVKPLRAGGNLGSGRR